ncbi:hypothetical protein JL722_1288 [Aureococcus anophagefferens]|nr:hypothetical protein JL722_1288 [Aureococcus anophagefferens]
MRETRVGAVAEQRGDDQRLALGGHCRRNGRVARTARAALLLLAVRTGAFFERGSDVVVIDSVAKWKEHNPAKSNHLWVISFYREGCGFCVLLEPELQKAATKLRKLVYFGAVDVEKHRTVADVIVKKHGVKIEGVPTIVAFSPTASASPFVYAGERKSSALVAFAGDRQPDFVKRLAGDDWSAAPDAFAARRVLLFTEKRSPTGLFKGLASRFRGEIDFGSVYCGDAGANTALRARYGVEHSADLPALVVVPNPRSDFQKATKAMRKLAPSGEGFRVPLGKKPSFMRLEFALMPFAEARFRAGKEARRRHGHHRKKHRKPEVYVDSSWQDSVWDDGREARR